MTSAPAARALYRGLWRQVRRFQADALPITGVVGLDPGPRCIDPLARLRAAFREGATNNGGATTTARLSQGLQALRTLPHQAAALEHAEEDARTLLARWSELQARWAGLRRRERQKAAPSSPPNTIIINTRVLEAGEEACALAYAATEEHAAERALDYDEADEIRARARRVLALAEPKPGQGGGGAGAARDLASRARRAVERVVAGADPSSSSASRYPSANVRAAAAASASLFAFDDDDGDGGDGGGGDDTKTTTPTTRLRSEPVEWVYDGVEAALPQPLLAGEVALNSSSSDAGGTSSGPPSRAARKGVPLALALAAARCLVDARALPGLVRCEPVSARDKDAEMMAAGRAEQRGSGGAGGALSSLPPAVAARQVGRTVAVAPATNTWLVRLDIEVEPETVSSWFVDVTKRGELLSRDEAKKRYPSLQVSAASTADSSSSSSEEEERSTLALWREVSRTLVLAHQRRGEADAVASWMRAAMALDPAAAEWARVLGSGSGGGAGGA